MVLLCVRSCAASPRSPYEMKAYDTATGISAGRCLLVVTPLWKLPHLRSTAPQLVITPSQSSPHPKTYLHDSVKFGLLASIYADLKENSCSRCVCGVVWASLQDCKAQLLPLLNLAFYPSFPQMLLLKLLHKIPLM